MNDVRRSIGWADWTWNPITGCRNGCSWCYARAMYERFGRSFEPAFHPERLGEPARQRKPTRIFCGSVTDFGSAGVLDWWIEDVFFAAARADHHRYLALTKRPAAINRWPLDWWVGVSVTRQADVTGADRLWTGDLPHRWVSCEPLLGPVRLGDIHPPGINWLVIGALTRGGRTVRPERGGTRREWVEDLVREADHAGLPVYVKDNVSPLTKEFAHRHAFPEGLRL